MAEKIPAKRASNADLSDVMTRSVAQKLTDKIAKHFDDAWGLLIEAHRRQAWRALGYSSWEKYVSAEFHVGRSRSYQMLDQAIVIGALSEAAGESVQVSERTARALKPALTEATAAVSEALAANPKADVGKVIDEQVAKAKVSTNGGQSEKVKPDEVIAPKADPKPAPKATQLSLFEEREGRLLVPARPPASREEVQEAKRIAKAYLDWAAQFEPEPGAAPPKRANPYATKPNQQSGRRAPAPAAGTPKAEKCLHPVTRRIGSNCAACGAKVGAK